MILSTLRLPALVAARRSFERVTGLVSAPGLALIVGIVIIRVVIGIPMPASG